MATPRPTHAEALTLEEHTALMATRCRNLTDHPIGATTAPKRHADAIASEIVTDHSIDVTRCPTGCTCEGCRLAAATVTARETSRRANARARAKRSTT